jgi:hypothetical protein
MVDQEMFELVPKIKAFFISIAVQILLRKTDVPVGLVKDLSPLTFIPWSASRSQGRACSQAYSNDSDGKP